MTDHEERFREIYDAYSGLILAYAARRTADTQDAADIVAETFTVAWRRMDDVPRGEEARPWLYGVARRVLANHHRGSRRRHRLNARLASQVSSVVDRSRRPVEGPDREAMAEAFAELNERDQELLKLVAWDDLDRADIAQILGCSRATVRVRLHRARKRFARHLKSAGVKAPSSCGQPTRLSAPAGCDLEEPT